MSSSAGDTDGTGDMTETITVGDDGFSLPVVEVLTGRGFCTGKSGSGKSNSMSVVAEELLADGYPLLIVDTDGEYYGLKEEYELLHVGADEECDIQVGPEHAERLATLALEDNVPIILDVSGFLDEDEASDLIRETASHLFAKEKKLKKPFLMLVEEVHEYIPEGGGLDETGKMLIKIGKRGRKHGLGLVGISQRPADVKKDFITQADWVVWHRLTWPNDLQTVGRVLGTDYKDEVQALDDGEAFVVADWMEEDVARVQWKRKQTFDAGATPDLGDFERPDLKSVSGDLVEELEEISEREDEREDRISLLEAELEDREDRIEELEQKLENQEDIAAAAQQMAEALSSPDDGDGATPEVIEEKNEQIRGLEAELEAEREAKEALREDLADARDELERRPDLSERGWEAVEVLREELGETSEDSEKWRQKYEKAQERIDTLEAKVEQAAAESGPVVSELEGYEEFLNAEPVQEEIEAAKAADKTSPRYIKGVLAAIIAEGGPVVYEDIADRLGLATNTEVSKAASELESRRIVTKDNRDGGIHVDLNLDGINEVRETAARREQTEDLMEDL